MRPPAAPPPDANARGKVEGWSVGACGTLYRNDESKLDVYADTGYPAGLVRIDIEYDRAAAQRRTRRNAMARILA